jgi:hypothetical protein
MGLKYLITQLDVQLNCIYILVKESSIVQEPFAKFVDSLYYSKSELCVGTVTVSFSKYRHWQVMHFLQHSTHFLKMCCRLDHFKIYCLGAPFSWLAKPRNHMEWDLDCMTDVLIGFHLSNFSKPKTEFNSDLSPCNLLAKGSTLKKKPSPHLHKVPTQSNKVSPQTLHMTLI